MPEKPHHTAHPLHALLDPANGCGYLPTSCRCPAWYKTRLFQDQALHLHASLLHHIGLVSQPLFSNRHA